VDKFKTNEYQGVIHHRSIKIEKRADIDIEARTIEVAFASETPVERYYGDEILDLSPQSVRLDRLNNGGAVLVNHDTRDQVGVVESARVDSDKVARALIRFSKGAAADEIFKDVVDGIRQLISFGYRVYKFEETKLEGGGVSVRALDWEPHEISVVAVPADASVGVGRSLDAKVSEKTSNIKHNEAHEMKEEKVTTEPHATNFDVEAERKKLRTQETERTNKIRAMSDKHGYDEVGRRAIEEGDTFEKFSRDLLDEIGKTNNSARAKSKEDTDLGLSRRDRDRFSFVKLMSAISNPNDRSAQNEAAFELEVSAESAGKIGGEFKARGAYIPDDILLRDIPEDVYRESTRDLSTLTAGAGGVLSATNLLAGSFIDVLRNAMVMAQAGVRMMPGLVGTQDIPRKVSGASATWIGAEDTDAPESEAAFDMVTLTPKDLACFTEVTRRLLQNSTPAADGLIRDDLAMAQALGLDSAILYGSGLAGQPTGVANQTGINTFLLAAANPTYAETIRMIREVMTDNALMGALSYIIDPLGWEAAMTTEKAANTAQFLMSEMGTMNGYQSRVTNQVAAGDWFFGNWADVLVGEWGGLELNVDPYTHSLKGRVRFITFKTADVAIRQPGSFLLANDGA